MLHGCAQQALFLLYYQVLGLLWNLAHSEDCPKEIMEQALAAHIKILDYSCAAVRYYQPSTVIICATGVWHRTEIDRKLTG
jgi:hypothetical protein